MSEATPEPPAPPAAPAPAPPPAARRAEVLRTTLVIVVLVSGLLGYVLHRRSQLRTSQSTVAPGEVPGAQSSGPARGGLAGPGREGDGPEGGGPEGEGPEGEGPEGDGPGPARGVEPGEPDPQGRPGIEGPRSQSACMQPVPGGGPVRFQVSGTATLAASVRTGRGGATVVLATELPLEQWTRTPRVRILAHQSLRDGPFRLDFQTTARAVTLCALRTTEYQEFASTVVAGCATEPVVVSPGTSSATKDGVSISMTQLETAIETIGLARIARAEAWPGTTSRRVTGTVSMEGDPTARFLVVLAKSPVLDQPDSEANPGAIFLTRTDGRFDVSMLAEPADPLFACALWLPTRVDEISKRGSLFRSPCKALTVPSRAASVPTEVAGVRIELTSRSEVKLTEHEREHFTFLARCLE